jgi:dTDP-4-amino-4,6-dideoxygalactose transaminase
LLLKNAVHLQRIRVFADRGNDAYPLSEIQAAVLLPQLDKMAHRNAIRQSSVELLRDRMSGIECLRFVGTTNTVNLPSYYKVAWRYNAQQGRWTREEFTAALRAEGVAADGGFRGFTRRSTKRCRHANELVESKRAASATVLLHHPVLLEPASSIEAIANAIRKVVDGYATGNG